MTETRAEPGMLNCVVIGCRDNTAELIHQMHADGLPVDAVVSLEEAVTRTTDVSGYCDLTRHVPAGVPVIKARHYSLKDPADRERLAPLRFRVGICIGWQRLLPGWFLDCAQVGVFGMHASRYYLPGGRGRSPITWSILEGAERVHATVFRYAEAADAGDILDVADVDITPWDTVQTVQQKCRIAFNRIVHKHWEGLSAGRFTPAEFPRDAESWYEKRTPESGHIDWIRSARAVHDFVRAQTRPYPGAFALHGGAQCRIWRGHPFGTALGFNGAPGQVLDVLMDGSVLIQCQDQPYLAVDHELPAALARGETLT